MTTTNPDGLPELPEPWTIRYHDDATGREIGPPTPLYTADQMHQYARDYAAALSQPAGVPDGWKLVPVEPTEVMCEAAMSSLGWTRSEAAAKTAPITPASPMMEGSMKVWSAMLATAPAASGVDTSTNEAWAARAQEKIEVMDAASVSERARELLVDEYMDSKFAHLNAIGLCIRDGSLENDTAISLALRAIEQALTQQRGHGEAVDRDAWAEALELPEGYTVEEFLPGGWHYAWTRTDGERMVSGTTWNHPALAAIAAWKYAPDTTPQPSADAVRELVLLSRGLAKRTFNRSTAEMYIHFADELESLISGGSHA